MLPLGEHSPANCVMLGQSPIVSEVWSALRDQSCVDLHAMVQFITANNKSRDLERLLKVADQRAPALGRIDVSVMEKGDVAPRVQTGLGAVVYRAHERMKTTL
jgi:hypothetical protein